MKTGRKIIIAILVLAIVCGAVLTKLGSERNHLLGVWKVSVSGESVLKNIIDFNAFTDAQLRGELNEKLQTISIPVRVQFNADNTYQISVDRRDAEAVTEQYVEAIGDYLVGYAKKNVSAFVDKSVSEATGNVVDAVKSYLSDEIQEKTDSMISGVMERILTDDDTGIANTLLNLLNKYLGLDLRNQADTVITGLLERLLSETYEHKVSLRVPQRGDMRIRMETARMNAQQETERATDREERVSGILKWLAEAADLPMLVYNIPLAGPLSVAPGLGLGTYFTNNYGVRYRELGLFAPIDFNLCISDRGDARLSLFAGPTLYYGLFSKDVSRNYSYYDTDNKRFDLSLGGGIWCDIGEVFRVKLGYKAGLLNSSKEKGVTEKSNMLTLAIGYIF